ncbi:MAG: hypothetical protein NVS9B2_00040 [Steroidobacteraceae bacterium]
MSQKSKDVILAYVDAFNGGDLDRLCSLFTPDALIWGVLGWGGLSAVRYVERGTAARSFRGAPATGRSYELTAMEWFVVQGELIHRRWGARDSAAQAKQLGWTGGS